MELDKDFHGEKLIKSTKLFSTIQLLHQLIPMKKNDGVQIVPNILQMNGTKKDKPIITRAPPPVPKTSPKIVDDLLLIDFSACPPQQESSETIDQNISFDPLITNHQSPVIETPPSSSSRPRPIFSNNLIDAQQFVAKVVTGVTEQLKHDFPGLNSSKKEYTPPLIRRFTVPYPSSYYNIHRPQ